MIEIKNIYGEVIFESSCKNLKEIDFSGKDLRFAVLEGEDFSGAVLNNVNLIGAQNERKI